MPGIWQRDVLDLLPGWSTRPLPLADTAVFCRKLSFLMGAEVSVKAALPIIEAQSGHRLNTALKGVYASVLSGDSLSSALKGAGVFPPLLCGLAAMGEAAGNLPSVFEKAAAFYERRGETKNELAGVLIYPALVGVLMLGVIVLAVTFVLPSYARVFASSGIRLPFLTQALLNLSDFMTHNGLYLAAAAVIGVLAALALYKGPGRGVCDSLILKIPLYRGYINARLSQALHLTLSAGLSVTDAVTIYAEISGNSVVRAGLTDAAAGVSSGMALHAALGRVKFTDTLLKDLIRVGEETASLAPIIGKCEKYFDDAYTRGVKRVNKLIEPLMTIILGALLGALMLAVILPTFRLAEAGW
jgi:type IV pilus assembly protein PilC